MRIELESLGIKMSRPAARQMRVEDAAAPAPAARLSSDQVLAELLPHVRAVSEIVRKIVAAAGKGKRAPAAAKGRYPDVAGGIHGEAPNTMLGEGEAAKHLPGGVHDAAPGGLESLLPSGSSVAVRPTLAGIVNDARKDWRRT
jgi:hypothetical protein